MNEEIQVFADNLKMIRKGRGLSQTQLAEKIGLTKQSIINYEKGNTFPTGNRLNKLLEALNITPEQLLGSENLQSESEKKLLGLVHEQANLSATIVLIQDSNDEDHIRNSLYNLLDLDSKSIDELIRLCHISLDTKINRALLSYSSDLVEQEVSLIGRSGNNLDIDAILKKD